MRNAKRAYAPGECRLSWPVSSPGDEIDLVTTSSCVSYATKSKSYKIRFNRHMKEVCEAASTNIRKHLLATRFLIPSTLGS